MCHGWGHRGLGPACSRGVEPGQGAVSDHRLWETAVLLHLRDAFRAGDVGDIRKTLLSAPAVVDTDRSLPKTLTVGFRPLPQTTRGCSAAASAAARCVSESAPPGRRGELVKVAGFALQAATAETERVAAKVQEGQTTH